MSEEITTEAAPEVEDTTLPSDTVAFEMPEKFSGKSAEEIAKAYVNLEKMHSKSVSTAKEEVAEAEAVPQPSIELVEEYMAKATDGLTDEHYVELADKGFSKDQVDTYAKGIEANLRDQGLKVLESIGTNEQEYNDATAFIQANWSADRIERFNSALTNATPEALPVLLENALHEYRGAKTSPAKITNTTQVSVNRAGYGSNEVDAKLSLQSDMQDRRYGKDAVYTKMVEEKVMATQKGVL